MNNSTVYLTLRCTCDKINQNHDKRSLPFFLKYLRTDLRVVEMNTIVTGDRSPERCAHKDVLVHHRSEWEWGREKEENPTTTHTTLSLFSFYADWHSMQHSPSSSTSLSFSVTLSHTHLPTLEDTHVLFELYSLSFCVCLPLLISCASLLPSCLAVAHVSLSHCIGLSLSHLACSAVDV